MFLCIGKYGLSPEIPPENFRKFIPILPEIFTEIAHH